MLSIHTNYSSANATNHVKHAHLNRNSSIEKLSTGKRINAAKDDPAGLAISMRLSAQVQGLKKASETIEIHLNYADVLMDTYDEMNNILIRMRELTLQGSNGTLHQGSKDIIAEELGQLAEQMNILTEVKINALTPLNDTNIIKLQIGANIGNEFTSAPYSEALKDIFSDSPFFISDAKTRFEAYGGSFLQNIDEAITLISSGNQYMGEVYNTLNHTLRNITTQSISLEISNGNIKDTDLALETTKLAKHQIAEQAGIAIAAQANASATIVLQLIN